MAGAFPVLAWLRARFAQNRGRETAAPFFPGAAVLSGGVMGLGALLRIRLALMANRWQPNGHLPACLAGYWRCGMADPGEAGLLSGRR